MFTNCYRLTYNLTHDAKLRYLKETGNTANGITVTVSHGDPQFARCVDLLGPDKLATEQSQYKNEGISGQFDSSSVTAKELLDVIEKERDQLRAEERATAEAYEAEVARLLTADPKILLCNSTGTQCAEKNPPTDDNKWTLLSGATYHFQKNGDYRREYHRPLNDERCASVKAAAEELVKRQDIKIRKLEAEAIEAAKKDMKDWVAAYGSKRLKLCVAEDIECDAIYRDERLALDRPGWCWYNDCLGASDEARNPPVDAFEVLEEARKLEPDAQLWFHVVEDEQVVDEDGYQTEEIIEGWRGYTAESTFLGKTISFGLPEEFRKKS